MMRLPGKQVGLIAFLFAAVCAPSDRASANMDDVVKRLLSVCMAGGSSEQVESGASGEVALTLKALKDGNIGGSAGVARKYTKSEWSGLQGGISNGLSQLQADQADKARECLKPYMPGIVQAILQSN
jgi:hypothetical protein